jgi:TatA/E family protein of Tat protein translocase
VRPAACFEARVLTPPPRPRYRVRVLGPRGPEVPMFGVGWTEILLILVVALLVLGPSKLPDIAKGLGKGIRDFKKALNSLDDDEAPRRASYTGEAPRPADPPATTPALGAPQGTEARGTETPAPARDDAKVEHRT